MFECDICKERFADEDSLTTHLLTHKKVKRYTCEICDKSYRNSFILKEHMYIHTGEKPYICEHCGKMFRVRLSLKFHLITHENKKRYKCEICDKCFSWKSNLSEHQRSHSGGRLQCDQCEKTFATRPSLSVHVKFVHNHDANILEKCHICDKTFKTKPNLKKHTKVHENECSRCVRQTEQCVCPKNRGVDGRDPLKSPFARDDLMLKCQTCSKMILRKCQLRNHLRIHENYKCLACNEDYKNCSCSDDHMEVSKSKNTYQKISQSSANAGEKVNTTEPMIEVKKEDNFTPEDEKNSVEFREIVVPKEEPKEEYLEIGDSCVESFTYATKVDGAKMAFNVKDE